MVRRYGAMLVLSGYLLFLFSVVAWGADWRLYSEDDRALFYLDAEGVTQVSRDIVRVWEKRAFKAPFVNDTVTAMGDNFKTLSYAVILREVDCVNKSSWIVTSHAYSSDYHVLSSTDDEEAAWNFIVPYTTNHELFRKVCK